MSSFGKVSRTFEFLGVFGAAEKVKKVETNFTAVNDRLPKPLTKLDFFQPSA